MMKNSTLVLATIGMLATTATQAQLLDVTNGDGELMNGTSVLVVGAPSDAILDIPFVCTLNGPDAKTVNMVRYELDACAGTQNYFCWGECWLPANAGVHPAWNAISPVTMSPGVANNGFHAYFKPMEQVTTCCFRFVWYDNANTTDSVWVDICFSTAPDASVDETAAGVFGFDIAPNPVAGEEVTIALDVAADALRPELVLVNSLGARAFVQPLAGGLSRTSVATRDLAPGVWMAQLHIGGKPVATRRLVVSGR